MARALASATILVRVFAVQRDGKTMLQQHHSYQWHSQCQATLRQ